MSLLIGHGLRVWEFPICRALSPKLLVTSSPVSEELPHLTDEEIGRLCTAALNLLGIQPVLLLEPRPRVKGDAMRTTKRMLLVLAIAGGLVAASSGAAFAHVHGITPLLACGNTAIDGANRTDLTPAAAANGGPITGLIPSDVGNAPLTVGDGGFAAAAVSNCQC